MTRISDEMNEAITHEVQRHQEPTQWDRVRDAILSRFANESDYYEIIIRGAGHVSNEPKGEPHFVIEMRLTLGQVREMK